MASVVEVATYSQPSSSATLAEEASAAEAAEDSPEAEEEVSAAALVAVASQEAAQAEVGNHNHDTQTKAHLAKDELLFYIKFQIFQTPIFKFQY